MPTYAVLVERELTTNLGHTVYIYLGEVDAKGPARAFAKAQEEFQILDEETVVTVPREYWRVWEKGHEMV